MLLAVVLPGGRPTKLTGGTSRRETKRCELADVAHDCSYQRRNDPGAAEELVEHSPVRMSYAQSVELPGASKLSSLKSSKAMAVQKRCVFADVA